MTLLEETELELVTGGLRGAITGWAVSKLLDAVYNSISENIGGAGESDASAMYAGQVTA